MFLAIAAGTMTAEAATLKVQPIQVCDDLGATCANSSRETYEAFTDAIWAQAGINVEFLPWNTLNSSAYLTLDSIGELVDLFGASPFLTLANPDVQTVSMWFVAEAFGNYGVATYQGNRSVISNAVFNINRVDTIAHELGHNLGIDHCDQGATPCDASYLMASGNIRSVPASISQIGTLDRLAAEHISTARGSTLLLADSPEPGTVTLFSTAGVGLFLLARRRRRG